MGFAAYSSIRAKDHGYYKMVALIFISIDEWSFIVHHFQTNAPIENVTFAGYLARMNNWKDKICSINTNNEFEISAIEVFNYQYVNNPVYHEFCIRRNINPKSIVAINQIPFLPVSFFKTHQVVSGRQPIETTFTSSGTTGMVTSCHHVTDLSMYEASFNKGFDLFYGKPDEYCILALLPSYLERSGSSLVYMAEKLIAQSHHPKSGFYLHNYNELASLLKELSDQNQKIILLGVTYALLNLAEQFPMPLPNTIIMETGGMKGQRREMVREELHAILCNAFSVNAIHSEYGMTELLSQAYSQGNGIFNCPPWMKIVIRDPYDPYQILPENRSGAINVIDLANINSCCFIETADLGKILDNGKFTIEGRLDHSDIRGCNLLA